MDLYWSHGGNEVSSSPNSWPLKWSWWARISALLSQGRPRGQPVTATFRFPGCYTHSATATPLRTWRHQMRWFHEYITNYIISCLFGLNNVPYFHFLSNSVIGNSHHVYCCTCHCLYPMGRVCRLHGVTSCYFSHHREELHQQIVTHVRVLPSLPVPLSAGQVPWPQGHNLLASPHGEHCQVVHWSAQPSRRHRCRGLNPGSLWCCASV